MRDYTKYSFYLSLLVLAGLACISFIPAFDFGGIHFKRANIFSELYSFGDELTTDEDAGLRREDIDFVREMQDAANYGDEGQDINEEAIQEETTPLAPTRQTWELGGGTPAATTSGEGSSVELENVTVIEDYSPEGAVHRFASLLGTATTGRNVRIAFLGDSFIEGDIITADVREQLQDAYGGQGVGFVALSSITAEYRPTVKHTFRGWKDYLLAQKKNTPEAFRDRFYVSGIISAPLTESWAQYETANYRKHLGEVSTLRLLYSSTTPAEVKFKVNDTHEKTFPADSTGQLTEIKVSGGGITKLRVTVPSSEGFAGYGVSLEGATGVLVDNYSIRSSTGLSLFGTSAQVNSQVNNLLGYDMIVLQYGLNIMDAEVTGYKSYGEQLRNLIRYIRRCFPSAAIVVMGVGDRSMLRGGEFTTMPAVPAMVAEQRSAARDCGVAFWNTYQAMGGYNSMKRFAGWGWAAKDYTHLSFAGGKKIATEFVKAVEYAKLHRYVPEEGFEAGDSLSLDPSFAIGRESGTVTGESGTVSGSGSGSGSDYGPDSGYGSGSGSGYGLGSDSDEGQDLGSESEPSSKGGTPVSPPSGQPSVDWDLDMAEPADTLPAAAPAGTGDTEKGPGQTDDIPGGTADGKGQTDSVDRNIGTSPAQDITEEQTTDTLE